MTNDITRDLRLPEDLVDMRKANSQPEEKRAIGPLFQDRRSSKKGMELEFFILYTEDHIVLWCNETLKQRTGFDDNSIIGHYCYELLFNRLSPCINCPARGDSFDGRTSHIDAPDEHATHSYVCSNQLMLSDEAPLKNLVIVQYRNHETKKGMGSDPIEARFRPFLETLPDVVGIVNREGTIQFSHPVPDYPGCDKFVGRSVIDVLKPINRDEIKDILESVFTTGEFANREIETVDEMSNRVRYGLSVWPITNGERTESAYLIAMNRTWEKESIEALLHTEKRFASIFEETNIGILVTDGTGVIYEANPTSVRMLELQNTHLVSTEFPALIDPEFRKAVKDLFEKLFMGMCDSATIDVRTMNGAGNGLWLHVIATPTTLVNGDRGCLIFCEDISERVARDDMRRRRIDCERELREIITRFAESGDDEMDEEIVDILSWLAEHLASNAAFIISTTGDSTRPRILYRWDDGLIDLQILADGDSGFDETSIQGYWSECIDQIMSEISSRDAPTTWQVHTLNSICGASIMVVPISYKGLPPFHLGVLCLKSHGLWTNEEIETLRSAARILSIVLVRRCQRDEYCTFFNISSEPLCIYDIDKMRFKKANPSFSIFLSVDHMDPKIDLMNCIYPPDLKRFQHNMLSIWNGTSETSKFTTRFISSSGEIKWVEMHGVPSSTAVEIYCVGKDITETKREDIKTLRSRMKYILNEGDAYLLCLKRDSELMDIIHDFNDIGYLVHYFSRSPSPALRDMDMDMIRVYWLAESNSKRATPPRRETILFAVEGIPKKAVIIIDRFDYLIFKQGFKEALNLVQRLRENAYLNEQIVIVSVDPETVSTKHLRLIRKECSMLTPVHNVNLPNELLDVLKVVRAQFLLHIETTYKDLLERLDISKPTLRKRLENLIYLGYIDCRMSGRRKCFLPTEKGLALLSVMFS